MSRDSESSLRTQSVPPIPGPPRSFEPPEIASEALANGLAVRLADRPRLPVASVSLVMGAGEALLPNDRAGLAVLSGRSLEGGTARRGGAELAEALEGLGTELRVRTGWDATTLSLTCLAPRLGEAVGLLAEVVREPAFPEGEVQRAVEEQRAILKQRRMDPAAWANDAFLPLLYHPENPYSRPLFGTVVTLDTTGRTGVSDFVEGHYGPERGGIVVAGDVDRSEVTELVRGHFAGWSGASLPSGEVEGRPLRRERRIVVLHRPDAVQSEIRIGHVGLPRSTPSYHALRVGNAILGGAFTSRLNLNLRERQGFTYGVRSRFAFRRGPGPFSISTAVSTEVTGPAVREAVAEVEGLVEEGPTPEEVEQAKDYLIGIFPLQFETTAQVATRAAELLVHRLPDDTHLRFRDRIRAVSRDDVHEALGDAIRPHELQVLVVGDGNAAREPLEALGLGPVEVMEP